ncbi:CHAT domain-containing protein [Acaryochloris sp. IP29b_bin.148]|uniref:CHAT domain-containing protein n=1 Tax=Acaryochloris sp. IP29b_bin.148 TaxID=2969218 RepID=UPI002634B9C8|nr:CHAT domain-containing protein [Acaryochloris sp. IP29b_bin.148]
MRWIRLFKTGMAAVVLLSIHGWTVPSYAQPTPGGPPNEPPPTTPPVETPPIETPPVETPPVETPPIETPPTVPTEPPSQSDINPIPEVDTLDPRLIPTAPSDISAIETRFAGAYATKFGPFFGEIASSNDISQELKKLARATNTNPALVYVIQTAEGLQVILVTASQGDSEVSHSPIGIKLAAATPIQIGQSAPSADDRNNANVTFKKVPEATVKKVAQTAEDFQRQISDPVDFKSTSYLQSAQQLHQWMIAPLAEELEEKKIDTLVFAMDTGLRSLPLAALHDGQQFLVEQYNIALIPSFSLTDTRYAPIQGKQVLGMGITKEVEGQSPLPSVAVEIPALTNNIWQGSAYLDPDVTLANLKKLTQQQQFDIIHLATHAEFKSGNIEQSYIQLWDGKLSLKELREVATASKWSDTPTVELLVLSACQTALGNTDAELGFTGLAIQSGVKSALGSLWYVSDEGTLGLMTGFYQSLKTAPIKSAALRQAQMAMLNGQVRITDDGQLMLADGTQMALPAIFGERGEVDFTHPYYWSSFTMVGNWN